MLTTNNINRYNQQQQQIEYHSISNKFKTNRKMSYTYRLVIFIFVFVLTTNLIYLTQSLKSKPTNNNNDNINDNKTSNAKLTNNKTIQIVVNYETLCPDSERFIVTQLGKAISIFKDNLLVQLIPFGKASYKYNPTSRLYEFDCQHGSRECFGNILHTCAIYLYPQTIKHFGFISCTITKFLYRSSNMDSVVNECAGTNLNAKKIIECANINLGNRLLYSMGTYASNMRPKPNWVPWIIVNGQHTDALQHEAESNLVGFLCKRFKSLNNQLNLYAC